MPAFKVDNRDLSIDILRAIALLGIMLVHVKPWLWLEQLRDFDVPLMVFLSAIVYKPIGLSWVGVFRYLKKRFVRLIIPTWFFITLLSVLSFALNRPMKLNTLFDLYTLQTQWYIWIIRVFFIIAVFSPIISYIVEKLRNIQLFIISLATLILIDVTYDKTYDFTLKMVYIQIPYFVVFAIGYVVKRLEKKYVFRLLVGSFILFISYSTYLYWQTGTFVPTGLYKYPPQIYYLSYAIALIMLLWIYRSELLNLTQKLSLNKILSFMGSHSLWVYFYHIIVLNVFENVNIHFLIKYAVVITVALIATVLQSMAVNKLQPLIKDEKIRKNHKIILDC